jgi:hypothetical protein
MRRSILVMAVILAGSGWAPTAGSLEVRPGVWAAQQPDDLPVPTEGYEVYLVGEFHGLAENAEFQLRYLDRLHRAGLRDVAIEEDAVYESDAQAYVDGKIDAVPHHVCLRAPVLEGIRRLNAGLTGDRRIRVHLTDIDSPAFAIRQHLVALQQRLSAKAVRIPAESAIRDQGLNTVAQLKRLNPDAATQSELRTVEFSVQALRQGLEVDIGPSKGSPYLDSREEAVASNILDLVRNRGAKPLLVIYGADHVSRTPRRDGGPNRDQPFVPTALRLERAGIREFSVITTPLTGHMFWRLQRGEIYGDASDGHLASGETLDKVLAGVPGARLLYIDSKREHARLPSEDMSKMATDAFLLFRDGTPMADRCGTR